MATHLRGGRKLICGLEAVVEFKADDVMCAESYPPDGSSEFSHA
jgi:hypothetical protein